MAAVAIAGYKQRVPHWYAASNPAGPGGFEFKPNWYTWETPWWAYAVAAAVALLGLALAVLIYPGFARRSKRTASVTVPIIR